VSGSDVVALGDVVEVFGGVIAAFECELPPEHAASEPSTHAIAVLRMRDRLILESVALRTIERNDNATLERATEVRLALHAPS
jgi:hypothetical protein